MMLRKTCIGFINCSSRPAFLVIGRWFGNGGRVASPGTIKKDWYDSQPEAAEAADKLVIAKTKKGYHIIYNEV